MAQRFYVHPDNPQLRLMREAARLLKGGGVIAYPTDSCYALGCAIGHKDGMDRIRALREVDDKHHFTLVCRDLSEIATYARVDNAQYRILKAATPGSYTFILEATREVPRRLQHPKRSTIGIRVPDHAVVSALLAEVGEPILSMSLILPGEKIPLLDPEEIVDALGSRLDLVVDAGHCGGEPSTVVDLSSGVPELVRRGRGELSRVGLD
jgi:tRNA threonylcarbamoyl adenosine modification protein (Sua5/YciO/YrdC/YwlC family)